MMHDEFQSTFTFQMAVVVTFSLLLSACGSSPATPTSPAATPEISPSPINTLTSEPTLTPTATLFPVPTLDYAEISARTGRMPLAMGNLDKVAILQMFAHPTGVPNMVFSADSSRLATIQQRTFMKDSMKEEDKPVRVWDIQSGKTTLFREAAYPQAAVFSPDGTKLIFDEGYSKLVIRDLVSGNEQSFNMKGTIQYLTFSPDGTLLVVGYKGAIVTMNLADNQWETVYEIEGKSFPFVEVSPDGKTVYFIETEDYYRNGIVKVLDLKTRDVRDLELVWGNPASSPERIALSHDGSFLAVASSFEVILWDRQTNQPRFKLDAGRGIIDISPDGKLLAGVTNNAKTIGIWDTEHGILLKTFEGNPDFLTSIAFSPDDTLLASADGSGNVILWGISDQPLNIPSVVIAGAEDSQSLASSISAAWLETPDKPARYQIKFNGSCKVLKTCNYTGGHSLIFRNCSVDVTINDLQKKTKIASKNFYGSNSTGICQEKREFSNPKEYQDDGPSRNDFSKWLTSVMKKQGY